MRDDEEKKDPNEMTTNEAADYLFPPEVVEHLKAVANGDDDQSNDESGNGNGDGD